MGDAFIQNWAFHLPNYVLAALMWSLAGRVFLSAMLPPHSPNVAWRALRRLTDPVIALFSVITPRAVPDTLLTIFSFIWLLLARFLLLAGLAGLGLAPLAAA